MAPRVHRGVFGLAYPQGAKKIGAFGAEPGIEPGTSCMLALRGARRRRGPKTGIIPLCWNLFTGLTIRPSVPKLKFIGGGERSFGLHTCGEKCFVRKGDIYTEPKKNPFENPFSK